MNGRTAKARERERVSERARAGVQLGYARLNTVDRYLANQFIMVGYVC